VDHYEQCAASGELQHALAHGILTAEDTDATLGEVTAVLKPGRTSDEEITLCDLTGVGVQDAAIASLTVARAKEAGVGRPLGD
jgi:ornithine cyclodeaminase